MELSLQFPKYEGSEGLSNGPSLWRKVSLAERKHSTELEQEPGYRWGRDTALVPIHSLLKYRELDRESEHAHSHSPGTIDSITSDLKQGGVNALREPIYLLYNHQQHWGWIGEGHHRLIAAQRAGLTHIPVRVMLGYKGEAEGRRLKGRGAPMHLDNRLVEKNTGYIPATLHPGNFQEFEGAR